MNTLGLSPEDQMEHGVALLRDAEMAEPDFAQKYLAAGMASCFTALFRMREMDKREMSLSG